MTVEKSLIRDQPPPSNILEVIKQKQSSEDGYQELNMGLPLYYLEFSDNLFILWEGAGPGQPEPAGRTVLLKATTECSCNHRSQNTLIF